MYGIHKRKLIYFQTLYKRYIKTCENSYVYLQETFLLSACFELSGIAEIHDLKERSIGLRGK